MGVAWDWAQNGNGENNRRKQGGRGGTEKPHRLRVDAYEQAPTVEGENSYATHQDESSHPGEESDNPHHHRVISVLAVILMGVMTAQAQASNGAVPNLQVSSAAPPQAS